ncbi:MAG: helix-turn-helix domain-containing protein [Bacteroidia bacterium]
MNKKYIVRLSESERKEARSIIKRLRDTSQKVRRAHILLKADADGPNWADQLISEAYHCRVRTVENTRKRFVEQGFNECLNRKKRVLPPSPKLLDGKQEAAIIAMRLGPAPKGYANWSLRLLSRKVVELGVVEKISHETVRDTLKKTA